MYPLNREAISAIYNDLKHGTVGSGNASDTHSRLATLERAVVVILGEMFSIQDPGLPNLCPHGITGDTPIRSDGSHFCPQCQEIVL